MAEKNGSKTTLTIIIACAVVVIFGILFIVFAVYLASRYLTNLNNSANSQSQSQTQSGNPIYTNNEWKFSVEYPDDFSKEDNSNGMGAEFTSANQKITLRSFAVLKTGNTASSYLDGIYSIAKKALPGRTVTEINKSNYKLGSLDGEMRLWKYSGGSTTQAEVRIAAIGGQNMYNISLTCPYDEYVAHMSLIEDMAQSFKVK